ncbi:hypothetical protein [Okeania hirsuta]|uniref:hypothetical protein n=1 Tax=Okeania hirsuta TaxID=1458930 RepID=UPI000F51DF0A|nr:hypothetical protein [Okeania hirsuta]
MKKSFSRGRRQPTPRPSPSQVGDNPPLAPPPPRRGRQEERGMSEEIGVSNCPLIFLPNYEPKILTF